MRDMTLSLLFGHIKIYKYRPKNTEVQIGKDFGQIGRVMFAGGLNVLELPSV